MKLPTLKNRWEFQRAYDQGRKAWNRAFVVYALPTPESVRPNPQHWRLGLTVTKKIGNSVVRNRIKRIVREALRLEADQMRNDLDIVVIARNPAADLSMWEAQTMLMKTLDRLGALRTDVAPTSATSTQTVDQTHASK
ncbi:MAG: ribonuclease P protein component [Candidatus Poribacteria bacterium]|nr:ribonuclease P protein component [Candidatus Poribacteria bacterium]